MPGANAKFGGVATSRIIRGRRLIAISDCDHSEKRYASDAVHTASSKTFAAQTYTQAHSQLLNICHKISTFPLPRLSLTVALSELKKASLLGTVEGDKRSLQHFAAIFSMKLCPDLCRSELNKEKQRNGN